MRKNMSDNCILWDEVYKFKNGETNDFSGILKALKEKCKQIQDKCENKYKPKKEKSEIQIRSHNKELNSVLRSKYSVLYKINNSKEISDLSNKQSKNITNYKLTNSL